MVRVEARPGARCEGALGVIPRGRGRAIERGARRLRRPISPPSPPGTAAAGVPVPALVAAAPPRPLGAEHGASLHWGATTQDIVDTALVLQLREVLDAARRPSGAR